MFSRTTSVRCVVSTLGGSTTVQPRNIASSFSAGSIHSAGRPNAGSRVASPGTGRRAALRVHRQQHGRAQFAAAGLDLLDADRVVVGAELHVVLDAHRRQHEAHLGGDRAAQTLDLLGQPRRLAAGQRQQAVAQLQPDHVDAQRVADRLLGGDRHRPAASGTATRRVACSAARRRRRQGRRAPGTAASAGRAAAPAPSPRRRPSPAASGCCRAGGSAPHRRCPPCRPW